MFTLQDQIGIQGHTLMTSIGDSQTMEATEVLEDLTLKWKQTTFTSP